MRLQTKLLKLVDCILRSTSTDDDRGTLGEAAILLSELASEDATFASWETSLSSLSDGDSSSVWDETLRRLTQLEDNCEHLSCVRQAAHTALRLRQLQVRFTESVERAKLEAIYHFAYGLSHELNNPLANIATRAGVLIQACDRGDQLHLLHAISDSAMRGCEMLGDLMLVARPPKLQSTTVDLSQLHHAILERGSRAAALKQIRFDLDWQVGGQFQLDAAMVLEIFWSLLRNAIEASAVGGVVNASVIRTFDQLRFQIDDDGPGLTPQALEHCFDPYFSGREAGRGLGLGLSKAKRFALIHGGDVIIENRPIRGCRATILIPCL